MDRIGTQESRSALPSLNCKMFRFHGGHPWTLDLATTKQNPGDDRVRRPRRSQPCVQSWSRRRPLTFIGGAAMPDTANALSSETGLSADMVHKGLGAILSFLRQHLGEETFERIQAAIPKATEFLNRFE